METVRFTRMRDGTAEEFRLVTEQDERPALELPDRILAALVLLREDQGPYPVDARVTSLRVEPATAARAADNTPESADPPS